MQYKSGLQTLGEWWFWGTGERWGDKEEAEDYWPEGQTPGEHKVDAVQ